MLSINTIIILFLKVYNEEIYNKSVLELAPRGFQDEGLYSVDDQTIQTDDNIHKNNKPADPGKKTKNKNALVLCTLFLIVILTIAVFFTKLFILDKDNTIIGNLYFSQSNCKIIPIGIFYTVYI